MSLKQKKNLLSGLLFSAFGLFVIYSASKIDVMDLGEAVTSSTFPVIVGALVLICGLFVMGSTLLEVRRGKPLSSQEGQPAQKAGVKGKFDSLSAALGFACFILYAVFFRPLGFIASSILFLFALTNVMSPKRPAMRRELFWLLLSILVPVVVYAVFVHLLSVPLPDGLIWF